MLQDANKLVVFGSQLVGVIIVVVGLLTQQAKLHSPRPAGSKTQIVAEPDRKGDRFARLWDDPLEDLPAFQVVSQTQMPSATTPGEGPSPITAVAALPPSVPLPQSSQSPSATKKLLIWNILDARPVPEIKERRLRTRYAIVSALLTADYLPLRESLLSPLVLENSGGAVDLDAKNLLGYFETFRAVDDKAELGRVTLVWTPKEVAIDEKIITSVRNQIASRDQDDANAKIHILHHGSSEDLANYVAAPKGKFAPDISFMRATIPIKRLRPNGSDVIPLSLHPITSDDVLVDALFRELSLRIPALNRTSPKHAPSDSHDASAQSAGLPLIVVFTESDTNYSRAIASELREKFGERATLAVYSYLRGLDGRPENIADTAESDKSKTHDSVSSLLQGRAISETSFGTSQFDYLRRLAQRLESETKGPKGRDVVAVGILGSDIYDKMLVLQAVRPELPAAIFFTTDLDALYLERENQPFTRNLVVASADSLDANQSNGLDWKLPPMRESYQTVLAKEVRELLSHSQPNTAPDATPNMAHVFEIAPGKSIELGLSEDASSKSGAANFVLRQLSKKMLNIFIFGFALGNAFLILKAVSTRKFSRHKDCAEAVGAAMHPWARTLVYAEVTIALLGILYLLYQVSGSSATKLFGEPLALGVSIWPSVMIRLLAFLVALILLLTASYSFVAGGTPSREKLEKALPVRMKLPLAHCLREESARMCRNVIQEAVLPLEEQTFDQHLEKLFDLNARRKRIILTSVFYLLASFFLFAIWPPSVPGRGAFSFLSEKVVLSLGVSLYIIHLIFCLDLHLSAFTFVRALRSLYSGPVQEKIALADVKIETKQMLEATSNLTSIIGKTLLYPLTVLILIILSRLRLFDNWVMTPSLIVTFLAGALLLVAASLILWLEGSRLKKVVLDNYDATPATTAEAEAAAAKEKEQLRAINEGVFAAWYNQPIFAAIFSAAAVFGSLSVAGPIARMFFGYS